VWDSIQVIGLMLEVTWRMLNETSPIRLCTGQAVKRRPFTGRASENSSGGLSPGLQCYCAAGLKVLDVYMYSKHFKVLI